MKSIELLSTGIRLVGFYAVIVGLKTASYQYQAVINFYSWDSENPVVSAFFYLSLAEVLIIFLAAFVMIKFPVTLARKLLPNEHDAESERGTSKSSLEVVLYSVLGVFILSWAIPDFVNNFIWIWYLKSDPSVYSGVPAEYVIHQIVTVVELSIGAYLTFQSKGLAILLRKFRGLEGT